MKSDDIELGERIDSMENNICFQNLQRKIEKIVHLFEI